MKRHILALLLACPLLLACTLPLSGCSALLERSYGGIEPYADRYWDPGAEDTLRVENYQDLVNSLLMLIEQRAATGAIRCYGEANSLALARTAAQEIRQETMLGTYLLEDLRFTYENNAAGGYCTLTYELTYRENAEDPAAIMTISDSQSLVDLLRLAVREGHDQLTARFSYDMPRRAVSAAIQSLWEELCRDEMEQQQSAAQDASGGGGSEEAPDQNPEETSGGAPDGASGQAPEEAPGHPPEGAPNQNPETASNQNSEDAPGQNSEEASGQNSGNDGTAKTGEDVPQPVSNPEDPQDADEVPPPPVYPPCPWTVRFYPDLETAELVEILLKSR